MSEDCLFCRVIEGTIPAEVVFENDDTVAIRDIHPEAPTHYLVLPRQHVATLNEASMATVAALFESARHLARRDGFAEQGYRTVINVHRDGGQTVWHLHLHVLAGRKMKWPPG